MVSKSWITLSRITIFQKAVCLPVTKCLWQTNALPCSHFRLSLFERRYLATMTKIWPLSLSRLISSEKVKGKNTSTVRNEYRKVKLSLPTFLHISYSIETLMRNFDICIWGLFCHEKRKEIFLSIFCQLWENVFFLFLWDFSRPENIPVRYDKGIWNLELLHKN